MKHLGLFLSLAVFCFWGAMNTLVVLRQMEWQQLDRYRQGVKSFLGNEFLRERWLGIYKDHKKIGYTSFRLEKVFADQGIELHSTVETVLAFDLFGRGKHLRVTARLVQDEDLKPVELQGDVAVDQSLQVHLSGKRKQDRFFLAVRQGAVTLLELPFPIEDLFLGDGFIPALPVAGFKTGETYQVPCFDPLTLSRELTTVKVVGFDSKEVEGLQADYYILESTFRGSTSTSHVTRDGELLLQKFGPPLEGVVLKKEGRERALRGVPR